jgi:hypothetical protein
MIAIRYSIVHFGHGWSFPWIAEDWISSHQENPHGIRLLVGDHFG